MSGPLHFVYRRDDISEREIQNSINAAWNDLLTSGGLQQMLRGQGVDVDLMKGLERCPFVVAPEADETALTQVAIRITLAFFTAASAGQKEDKESAEQFEKILAAYLLPRLFEDHGAHALGPRTSCYT